MSTSSRDIMQAVPKGIMNGLVEISIKTGDIIKMADAIELITWQSNSEDGQATNGVASGIAAIAIEVGNFINALESAENKNKKAASISQEELNTAIIDLEAARLHLAGTIDTQSAIEAVEGSDSQKAKMHDADEVAIAHEKVTETEAALLAITPATPLDYVRKFAVFMDDGGSDINGDPTGHLIRQAQAILINATDGE